MSQSQRRAGAKFTNQLRWLRTMQDAFRERFRTEFFDRYLHRLARKKIGPALSPYFLQDVSFTQNCARNSQKFSCKVGISRKFCTHLASCEACFTLRGYHWALNFAEYSAGQTLPSRATRRQLAAVGLKGSFVRLTGNLQVPSTAMKHTFSAPQGGNNNLRVGVRVEGTTRGGGGSPSHARNRTCYWKGAGEQIRRRKAYYIVDSRLGHVYTAIEMRGSRYHDSYCRVVTIAEVANAQRSDAGGPDPNLRRTCNTILRRHKLFHVRVGKRVFGCTNRILQFWDNQMKTTKQFGFSDKIFHCPYVLLRFCSQLPSAAVAITAPAIRSLRGRGAEGKKPLSVSATLLLSYILHGYRMVPEDALVMHGHCPGPLGVGVSRSLLTPNVTRKLSTVQMGTFENLAQDLLVCTLRILPPCVNLTLPWASSLYSCAVQLKPRNCQLSAHKAVEAFDTKPSIALRHSLASTCQTRESCRLTAFDARGASKLASRKRRRDSVHLPSFSLQCSANPLRLLGRKIMQEDMHRGKEGLGSHGLHFGATTTSLNILRAILNYEEQEVSLVRSRMFHRTPSHAERGQSNDQDVLSKITSSESQSARGKQRTSHGRLITAACDGLPLLISKALTSGFGSKTRAADFGCIVFDRCLDNALDYSPRSLSATQVRTNAVRCRSGVIFWTRRSFVCTRLRSILEADLKNGSSKVRSNCERSILPEAEANEQWSDYSPPTKANRVRFTRWNRAADDAATLRLFSGIFSFPRSCIPALLRTQLTSLSLALQTSLLRYAKIPFTLIFSQRVK
ncbi:hypothetical protein PR048_025904 [Dryococelus australis]|uniref:Uncharacterized protein n=1 Tax=Dryococelus australis TaxID=614101 RepID=A0ABQ9GJU9_9NEOP|nr:hypothetical protein PR048_025904 [Dryococelus australis]